MYIHGMIRMLFHLDEAIHARLRELARKQGRTVSELVREALVRTYGTAGPKELLASLRAISGLRKDRKDIGVTDEHVRRRRRVGHRVRRLGK